MTNNSISYSDTQICNNLDVRVKHDHNNIIEQSGRSMIEMLGVLAIIGVLSVGGIAGYSKAMTKFKINKTADQVSQIVTNIRTLYAQQTSYSGLNNATAISMGVIPDELGTNATTGLLTNTFGGQVFVDGYGRYHHGVIGFHLSYQGLSKEACVTLASSDWGSNFSSGLLGIQAVGFLTDSNMGGT